MTSLRNYDTITPVLEYEDSTGFILLSDGAHRSIICKKVDNLVILHWKYDGTAVRIPLEEWNALFTE